MNRFAKYEGWTIEASPTIIAKQRLFRTGVVIKRDECERFVFSDLGNRVYRWQAYERGIAWAKEWIDANYRLGARSGRLTVSANKEIKMPLKDVRSVFMPYCIKRESDGRYAILNREYKPVGFWTKQHVAYEDHPVLVKIKGLTAARAAKISYKGDSSLECIYLYNDGRIPTESTANMNAYLARLAVLAKLELDGEPPRA
jgi:hypothetical protein